MLPAQAITMTDTTPSSVDALHASPFFYPGLKTRANSLAIIQLSRDDLVPVYLRGDLGEHDGYKEGHVLNTRFGSFPHSTLIGVPWGSQVRASNVDTGSRGRRGVKRKRGAQPTAGLGANDAQALGKKLRIEVSEDKEIDEDAGDNDEAEAADAQSPSPASTPYIPPTSVASSGFVHILPPTPEAWTSSLPHRTQVVYTPDYSYILHRIRARPGTRIIEAGAGSGSFTHASARAVYGSGAIGCGKVFSFEFNVDRYHSIKKEVIDHGLASMVEVNQRDVYKDGFGVGEDRRSSPKANAVFLDLPAPWLALRHLARTRMPNAKTSLPTQDATHEPQTPFISPLDPAQSVHICTFSPCIEQVSKTVSEMRRLGWVDIDMVEIAHRKIQLSREKVGLQYKQERGAIKEPKDVGEAVARLRDMERRSAEHQAKMWSTGSVAKGGDQVKESGDVMDVDLAAQPITTEEPTLEASDDSQLPPYLQGNLVTRTSSEIKAHTSYLVFAVLPREWTAEDEAAAAAEWPCDVTTAGAVIGAKDKQTRKKERRELLAAQSRKNKNKKTAHIPRTT